MEECDRQVHFVDALRAAFFIPTLFNLNYFLPLMTERLSAELTPIQDIKSLSGI